MKFVSILSIFFLITPVSIATEKKMETSLNKLLTFIGVQSFSQNVAKLKIIKSIDKVESIDYELKHFFSHIKPWYYFDNEDFVKSLREKLKSTFNEVELKYLVEKFKDPFLIKVLNHSILYRDVFSLNQDIYREEYKLPQLPKSRYTLVQNVYVLHGMEIQKEYLSNKIQNTIKSGKTLMKILKDGKEQEFFVDSTMIEKRRGNLRDFLIKDLSKDLKAFRHYELREYLRVLKGDKLAQKFVLLYANFHFIYLSKYINKVETDKLNQLKAI